MPRVDDKFLDCSVYLYPGEEEAKQGKSIGGSGLLAAIPGSGSRWLLGGKCPSDDFHHCYAVTNKHVAMKHPVVRLNRDSNTPRGRVSVIPFACSDWFVSCDHDVAVVPIDYIKGNKYEWR